MNRFNQKKNSIFRGLVRDEDKWRVRPSSLRLCCFKHQSKCGFAEQLMLKSSVSQYRSLRMSCLHFVACMCEQLLLILYMSKHTGAMSLQSFLHLHDSPFSYIITSSHACWTPSLACSSSTGWYINMLLFKESLTSHLFWPHNLQFSEKTACD